MQQIGKLARKVLADVERAMADKASGGLKRPEQIHDTPVVPRSGEKAGSRSETGEATLQGSPQLTVTGRGVGDGLVLKADNDNWRDRSQIEGRAPVAGAGRRSALGE